MDQDKQEQIINNVTSDLKRYLTQFTKDMLLRQAVTTTVHVMAQDYWMEISRLEDENYKSLQTIKDLETKVTKLESLIDDLQSKITSASNILK